MSLVCIVFMNHIYLIYMYKEDLALNKQQCFICHETKPNKTKPGHIFFVGAVLPICREADSTTSATSNKKIDFLLDKIKINI